MKHRNFARFSRLVPAGAFAAVALTLGSMALPAGGGLLGTAPHTPVAAAAPAGAKAKCPPTLSEGSRGDNVRYLQDLLNTYGRIWGWPTLASDGIFGGQTKGLVIALQYKEDLEQDGIVGPKTWHALDVC